MAFKHEDGEFHATPVDEHAFGGLIDAFRRAQEAKDGECPICEYLAGNGLESGQDHTCRGGRGYSWINEELVGELTARAGKKTKTLSSAQKRRFRRRLRPKKRRSPR